MKKKKNFDIKDLSLAKPGRVRIEWAARSMPVLKLIGERFEREKPLRGVTIGACLHVTSEAANLLLALKAGGAQVALCASNPLSTQDEVAASLVKDFGFAVFAVRGESNQTYYRHLHQVLQGRPQITMDDGADLVTALHTTHRQQLPGMLGSSEETTTGVIRLKALAREGKLGLPVMAANDSLTKHMFDNRYGTGQSTLDGMMRATNALLAGKTFVIAGYGWCGRGLANRARGMGANVIITEADHLKALEAVMDGFRVVPMAEAARVGDIFVTATGNKRVITTGHMRLMKDGAILANTGHFNVEFDYNGLVKLAARRRTLRTYVEEFVLSNGKKIFALGEGRLINLVAAEGHPAEVMDMSLSNQALAAEYFVKNKGKLQNKVYVLPAEADAEIARLKLAAMRVEIDRLTAEQKKYLSSWQEGT